MSAVLRSPVPRARLIDRLRLAMLWAVDRKIPLSADGSYGVHCTSRIPPQWERDPRAKTIDPVGAAILREQPETTDLLTAAMMALGADPAELAGFEHGLMDNLPSQRFMDSPVSRLYVECFEYGLKVRMELVARACFEHGKFAEVTCPTCEQDLDARLERADELGTDDARGHA